MDGETSDDDIKTHYKLFIKDLLKSEYTEDNCFNLSRTNIYFNSVLLFGTVIDIQNMHKSVVILLDDSTGVIQLRIEEKLFKLKKLPKIGDNINCVGKLINSNNTRFIQLNSFDFIKSEQLFYWEILNNLKIYENHYFKSSSNNSQRNVHSQKSENTLASISEVTSANETAVDPISIEVGQSNIDDSWNPDNSIDELIINFDLEGYLSQHLAEPPQPQSSQATSININNDSKVSSLNPTQVVTTPTVKEEMSSELIQLDQYLKQFIEDGVLLSRINNDLTLDNIEELIDKLKVMGKLDVYCGRVYPNY